jgi:hypothetical protein
MRGSRDPSGQSWERARENRKGRRRDGWREGRGERGEGRGEVFMVVEKSGGAQLHARSPIGRLLNPGGQTARLRLLLYINLFLKG